MTVYNLTVMSSCLAATNLIGPEKLDHRLVVGLRHFAIRYHRFFPATVLLLLQAC